MATLRPDVDYDGPSAVTEDRTERICRDFQQQWQSGLRPRIEDFLDETALPDCSTILVQLIRLEVEYRRLAGEQVRLDEFVARFPKYARQLSDSVLSGGPDSETVAWQPSAQAMIAHFALLEQAGRGSFGAVWKARDTRLNRIVAIKVPRSERLEADEAQRMLHEAQAAAQLHHPNIISIHEVGLDGDPPYIVCDYVEGVNLKEWLAGHRPSIAETTRLCVSLADALQHAHERGVIHRDLKPGNILLDRSGEPHVADFGLAKHTAGDRTISAAGEILGTPAYMSPEQAAGEGRKVDARTDVYSLGVILYELLTGKRPFTGGERVIIHRVLTQEPSAPRKLEKRIPRDLETICLTAMAKDPGRRYATAGQLAEDLRRFERGEPIRARRIGVAERGLRWAKRKRGMIAAALLSAIAATLLAFGIVALLPSRRGDAANAPVGAAAPAVARQRVTLATDPPGATVVFVPIDAENGLPRPEGLQRAGSSPVEIELAPGDYWVVAHREGHGFHEVQRHVPGEGEGLPEVFRHSSWTHQPGGAIELPTIDIPAEEIVAGMAYFEGSQNFRMGHARFHLSPVHGRRVLPFHLDPTEFTVEQYRALANGSLPPRMNDNDPSNGMPVSECTFHEATHYAERAGKRLPEEWEYEFAATNGGKQAYPWGSGKPSRGTDEHRLAPVRQPEWDRLESLDSFGATVSVYGLCSNVAEWTNSWPNQPPFTRVLGDIRRLPSRDVRIVRGGSDAVMEGMPDADEFSYSPHLRLEKDRLSLSYSGLGFRCARSAAPRLRPEDWAVNIRLPD